TAQTSISQTLTNTGTTDATVVYTVTPMSGTCAGSDFTITVTVNPSPAVSSSATGSVCSEIAQNYTITSNVPSNFSWTRNTVTGISNAAVTSSTNPINETLINTTTAPVDVVYTITPTSTAGSCAGTTFTYTVTVNPKPVVSIIPSGPTAFCSNQSVDLTASASGFAGGTVEWFNGSTSLGNSNPLTVNAAGSYTVVYTSSSSCASLPSASVSITINADNSPAIAANDFATCLGSATLVGNVPANGTGTWSVVLPSTAVVTAGSTAGTADASNLVDGNTYTFVYTVSGACGPDQTDQVVVTAGLTGLAVTASGPTDTLCVRTNRALSANATGGSGNYSYVWVSSDGSFSSTSNNGSNVTVQPASGGETIYTVYVIDNVNIGCRTNDATVKVNAVESQDLNIPNLITPNGDNLNDVFILKDKVTKMDIIKDGSHVEVVNRWGAKVYEANNYENNWVPKDVTDGVYYYHITSSCGNKEYKSWLQILGNTNN
ncbi:MAG TPA: PKD-like domain-containing protein, partial [Cytophaga sp.]|nr:PKD-like domain-containing protein [Cytophaga sp.]